MSKPFLQRKLVRIALVLLALFLLLQFFRPSLDNPPVTGDLKAPAEVKEVLKRACYDCHSNETELKWFDKPMPAYALVVSHIKDGRRVLNFSNWDSLTPAQQKGKLFESLNQIVFREMPLSQYTAFHHEARISLDDISVLRNYLSTLAYQPHSDTARQQAANTQYYAWITAETAGTATDSVLPEYNGIEYPKDYREWQPISTTERWDNGTLRVILGNPTAIKAIRDHNTNPWPDGTAFAKLAWDQNLDTTGGANTIKAGEFKQVEFMFKDKEKYASTNGWGFGRWLGSKLKPYGKNRFFTSECVNCHQPMEPFDYVFTMPINTEKYIPNDYKLITSGVDKKSSHMYTLYGNDIAVAAARKGQPYPKDAALTLTTWSQKDDFHWYGGNIPDSLLSVEKINPDSLTHHLRASVIPK